MFLTVANLLLFCEAKHTEKFDEEQLKRTWNIAEVCAKLLYKDLGFIEPPIHTAFKLGAAIYNSHISWLEILVITKETYKINDRTIIISVVGRVMYL